MHYKFVTYRECVAVVLLVAACASAAGNDFKGAGGNSAKAALYEEDQSNPLGKRYVGFVRWATETTSTEPKAPAALLARALVEIPEKHLTINWSLRRNTEKSLPASHTIEIEFKNGANNTERDADNVPGVLLKSREDERGAPLAGLSVKVKENFFLIGLSAKKADVKHNASLLDNRDWLDIPIFYRNGRRAILTFEKGELGKVAIAAVLGTSQMPSTASSAPTTPQSPPAPEASPQPDEAAPLGLTWGSPLEHLTDQGIALRPFAQKDFGETYLASKLPRALNDQETTFLSFGFDDKLFRVAIVSRAYENDPSGNAIRNRYSELLATLSEKYGKPYSVQDLGDSIYREPKYFLAGINGGQSHWYSNFETPQMVIQLALIADTASTGRWRVVFEQKSLTKSFNSERKSKEKSAL